MTTVLITGAGGSASANVVDSLRKSGRGYWIVGADASTVRLHLSEADERVVLPRVTDERYDDALIATLSAVGADVLHIQPDAEVFRVGMIRDRLPARTILPTQTALTIASNKDVFARHMAEHGVPVPESRGFASRDDIADEVSYLLGRFERVWVRAKTGAGARASLPVTTPDQALHWVDWWCEEKSMAPSDFMAAEMLPGREFAYQSVWQASTLVAGQARERVEYLYGFLTPSGQTSTPAVARTVAEPEIDELAIKAIRALDSHPNGVYCVDIKTAQNGVAKVTEINAGRFFTTSNFFAAAGLNMPDMAVRAALGETLPSVGTSPLEPGLYWLRMVDMGCRLVHERDLGRWASWW